MKDAGGSSHLTYEMQFVLVGGEDQKCLRLDGDWDAYYNSLAT